MQGRYAAQVVSGDHYLLNCSRYIHLNPVKTTYWEGRPLEECANFLQSYLWSSHRSYIGLSPTPSWLNTSPILALLPNTNTQSPEAAYQEFVEKGLHRPDDVFEARIKSNPLALGSDDFVLSIKNMYGSQAASRIKKEDTVLRKERFAVASETVMSAIVQLDHYQPEHLYQRRYGFRERCLTAMALQKFSNLTQREISLTLKLTTGAAVSAMITKHRNDPQVMQWMKELNLYFKG